MVTLAKAVLYGLLLTVTMLASGRAEQRPRVRELGVAPGVLPPGRLNAITDVDGVRVGHRTIVEGDDVRTGVTAVLPHGDNLFQSKVPAAVYVGNGFGKAAGFLQVQELGNIETPIVLTNTLSVGRAVEAVVQWTLARPGNEEVRSVNALVGEVNDGYLNDIRGMHVTAADVHAAIDSARGGPVEEGSVGAGVGTRCLGFKGGIGTASRKLPSQDGGYTVGVLVQTNYGGLLRIDGKPVGELLGRLASQGPPAAPFGADGPQRSTAEPRGAPAETVDPPPGGQSHFRGLRHENRDSPRERLHPRDVPAERRPDDGDGSVMIVLATDAPLTHRNLQRFARRAVLGLARTGSWMSNGSGDFVIAFSTRNRVPHAPRRPVRVIETLENDRMGPLFLATVEAVEEAVYSSLVKATTVTGKDGHTVEAIPIDALRRVLSSE
jgi:D-aminopeptidase